MTETTGIRSVHHHGRARKCPRCGSEDVRRSKRRLLERAVSAVGLYPYRCRECGRRFLSWASGRDAAA